MVLLGRVGGDGNIRLGSDQTHHFFDQRGTAPAAGVALQADTDRDGPEASGRRIRVEARPPAARGDLSRVGAQTLGVEPFNCPLDQRR